MTHSNCLRHQSLLMELLPVTTTTTTSTPTTSPASPCEAAAPSFQKGSALSWLCYLHCTLPAACFLHHAPLWPANVFLLHAMELVCRLKEWLDTLLWERGADTADVYRMKGILSVAGSDRRRILQVVHELYDIYNGMDWAAGEQRESRVVVIGRNLAHGTLQDAFDLCLGRLACDQSF